MAKFYTISILLFSVISSYSQSMEIKKFHNENGYFLSIEEDKIPIDTFYTSYGEIELLDYKFEGDHFCLILADQIRSVFYYEFRFSNSICELIFSDIIAFEGGDDKYKIPEFYKYFKLIDFNNVSYLPPSTKKYIININDIKERKRKFVEGWQDHIQKSKKKKE